MKCIYLLFQSVQCHTKTIVREHIVFFFSSNRIFLHLVTCFCAYSQNKRYYLACVFCLFVLKSSTLLCSLFSQCHKQKRTLKMQRWHSWIWRAGQKWSQRLCHMFSNNSIYINDGSNASFASVTLIRPQLPLLFQLFPLALVDAVKLLKSKLTYLFDFS